jgi:hypothetical protein
MISCVVCKKKRAARPTLTALIEKLELFLLHTTIEQVVIE